MEFHPNDPMLQPATQSRIVAAPPPHKASSWRPLAAGLLIGTLAIGAPVGGVVGGLAGAGIVLRNQPAIVQPAIPPSSTAGQLVAPAPTGALDVAALYKRAVPSIVQINTTVRGGGAIGSGFVIDTQGHILTNNHVIEGATSINVVFSGGTSVSAKVVGRDKDEDLAILEAKVPDTIRPIALANSDAVQPGEPVVAVGSPLGQSYSVTSGIVSGVGRVEAAKGSRPLRGLIQTDAAINPGNSGGPLLNARGEVVGINTLGETGAGGIGFAVPSNTATRLLPRLLAGETITHAYLGISAAADQPSVGVAVADAPSGGPAANAGIRAGDVITSLAGTPVKDLTALRDAIDAQPVGSKVDIQITRNGREQTVNATLVAWPTQG